MQNITIFNKNFSPKILSAIWFGALATIAVLIFPTLSWISSSLITGPDEIKSGWVPSAYSLLAMSVLHYVIPVIAGIFWGRRLGESIIVQHFTISTEHAFGLGVKIALYSGISWLVVGMLWIGFMAILTDVSHMGGGMVILAIFGFPVYSLLSGVGGIVLKKLVTKVNRSAGGAI